MPDNNAAYMKLITSEYADKPNYNAYVKSFLDKVSPIVDSFDLFNTLFNIDNAEGDQLDKIGQIVGVQRELPISDPDIPSVLDDDLFRAVIRARIYSNLWDGTNEGLIDIINKTFPNASWQLIDGQDMSMQIVMIIPDADPALIALMFNGYIIPKPSGVDTAFTIQENALFGFDSDTAFVKGWDLAQWNNN